MWVNKRIFQGMRDELVAALATRDLLGRHNTQMETSLDWLRVRVSQMEHERAIMLSKYMGIDVPVQVIERAKPAPKEDSPYHGVPHFNDVGDAEAKKLGIAWNLDGSVTYDGTR
jgi:hypothetical protein